MTNPLLMGYKTRDLYEMVSKSKSQSFLILSGTHMSVFFPLSKRNLRFIKNCRTHPSPMTLTIEHGTDVITFRAQILIHSLANTCRFGYVSLEPRPTTSNHIPLNYILRCPIKISNQIRHVYLRSLFTFHESRVHWNSALP